MLDVISIGNATLDVFIELDVKKKGKCIMLPCGSKQEAKGIFYSTGGGATNTAVAFSRLGLKTGILAAVGRDGAGERILNELRGEKVDASLVAKLDKYNTAYSAILTGKGFDRIILTYGGATTHLEKDSQVKWGKLGRAKWFYVSSFHSNPKMLRKIFGFAARKGIGIAWNPGKSELKEGLAKLRPLLEKTRILLLNESEAKMLARGKSVRKNMERLSGYAPLVVVTRGKKGSIAFDGIEFHEARAKKVMVKDSTGAGDAFNSGFVAGIVKGKSIGASMEIGSENAAAVLKEMGAKNNLLRAKIH